MVSHWPLLNATAPPGAPTSTSEGKPGPQHELQLQGKPALTGQPDPKRSLWAGNFWPNIAKKRVWRLCAPPRVVRDALLTLRRQDLSPRSLLGIQTA